MNEVRFLRSSLEFFPSRSPESLIKRRFRHKATWMEIWDGDFEASAMIKNHY